MAMRASSSSDAGVSIAAQPHQGSGTRNGRTMCGALTRSHTNAANLHASRKLVSLRRLQRPERLRARFCMQHREADFACSQKEAAVAKKLTVLTSVVHPYGFFLVSSVAT